MPAPGPEPHDLDASPSEPASDTLPSLPTERAPTPGPVNGRTTNSWVMPPTLSTTNDTVPAGTVVGDACSPNMPGIAPARVPLPIMGPPIMFPISRSVTVTTEPGSDDGAVHEVARLRNPP